MAGSVAQAGSEFKFRRAISVDKFSGQFNWADYIADGSSALGILPKKLRYAVVAEHEMNPQIHQLLPAAVACNRRSFTSAAIRWKGQEISCSDFSLVFVTRCGGPS